jgi:hypothetical protein
VGPPPAGALGAVGPPAPVWADVLGAATPAVAPPAAAPAAPLGMGAAERRSSLSAETGPGGGGDAGGVVAPGGGGGAGSCPVVPSGAGGGGGAAGNRSVSSSSVDRSESRGSSVIEVPWYGILNQGRLSLLAFGHASADPPGDGVPRLRECACRGRGARRATDVQRTAQNEPVRARTRSNRRPALSCGNRMGQCGSERGRTSVHELRVRYPKGREGSNPSSRTRSA